MITVLVGDDERRINNSIAKFSEKLDLQWKSCNYHRFPFAELDSAATCALSLPFGTGASKLVVVEGCNFNQLDESAKGSLEMLPMIPTDTHLVLVAKSLDKRLKVVKSLLATARVIECNLILPWRTDEIARSIQSQARNLGLNLGTDAVTYLAEAIGNDTARAESELKKLATYAGGQKLTLKEVYDLVPEQTQSSLQLADAIRNGDVEQVRSLLTELSNRAEPPLIICRTLQTQFRTWLWVKTTIASGIRQDWEIAKVCQINNPKRVYFLKNDVAAMSIKSIARAISRLLDLELALKQGYSYLLMLTRLLEIALLFER